MPSFRSSLEEKQKAQVRLYKATIRYYLSRELLSQPDMMAEVSGYTEKFLGWAAAQRFIFCADLPDEIREFKEIYIKRRIYNVDVKLWKRISGDIFRRDGYACAYCPHIGSPLEVDHIIPISRGGTSAQDNLTTACRPCNRSKRNMLLSEWMEKKCITLTRPSQMRMS